MAHQEPTLTGIEVVEYDTHTVEALPGYEICEIEGEAAELLMSFFA